MAVTIFRADPARIADLKQQMHDLRSQLKHTLGCTDARLFQDTGDAASFTLVECWETKEQQRANLADLVESDMWSAISRLLAEEPEHRYFAEL